MIGCSWGCFSERKITEKKMPGPEAPRHQKHTYQSGSECSCMLRQMIPRPMQARTMPTKKVLRGPLRSTSSP